MAKIIIEGSYYNDIVKAASSYGYVNHGHDNGVTTMKHPEGASLDVYNNGDWHHHYADATEHYGHTAGSNLSELNDHLNRLHKSKSK